MAVLDELTAEGQKLKLVYRFQVQPPSVSTEPCTFCHLLCSHDWTPRFMVLFTIVAQYCYIV
jgi:hypothetical protein